MVVCPLGTEKDAKYIVEQFSKFTDVSEWQFVFASTDQIQGFYNQMKLQNKLNSEFGTSNVFIVDKNRNLRGRKKKSEYKEGYDTSSPAELGNIMLDDFKIILYEYRAALKKNHNAERQI